MSRCGKQTTTDCKRHDNHSSFHRLVDLGLAGQAGATDETLSLQSPFIHVDTLLENLLFLVGGTRYPVGQVLGELDLAATTVAVPSAERYAFMLHSAPTVNRGSVVLSDFEDGLSFLRGDLHFLGGELVHKRFQGERD